jgi:hypothetical protein
MPARQQSLPPPVPEPVPKEADPVPVVDLPVPVPQRVVEPPPVKKVEQAPSARPETRKVEPQVRPAKPAVERSAAKNTKAAQDPECEKILMRMSLGEAGQDLIDRMKTLNCK